MWFIVLLCISLSFLSNAQQTINTDSQTATEVGQPNQEVRWDNIRPPPVTLSIRDGRSETAYRSQDEASNGDQTLFYSNEWQPFILPIGFNQYGDRSRQPSESEYSIGQNFLPTYLRRPDSVPNRTAIVIQAERNPFFSSQIPHTGIPLYPNPFNLYPNENGERNYINALQNDSTASQQILLSDSTASSSDENPTELSQSDTFPFSPDVPSPFYPLNFYSRPQGFMPPRGPIYFPYPVSSFARDDSFQQAIRDFSRESGADVNENTSPTADATDGERPSLLDSTNANEGVPEQNIPSEPSSNNVPPQVPYPVGAYPFGLVPPSPFVSPFIPNTLPSRGQHFIYSNAISGGPSFVSRTVPRSISFNIPPFPQFTNRPENQDGDAVLPAPVVPPLPGSPPLAPPDVLAPELPLPPNIDESILRDPEAVKIPYEFGFDMNDGLGTDQHRKEVSDGSGVVTGSYGYRDLYGVYRLVNYVADKGGFRAIIKSNEPGVASAGSANVVVVAEPPPPHAIAEGITAAAAEPEVVVAAEEAPALIAAASESETK